MKRWYAVPVLTTNGHTHTRTHTHTHIHTYARAHMHELAHTISLSRSLLPPSRSFPPPLSFPFSTSLPLSSPPPPHHSLHLTLPLSFRHSPPSHHTSLSLSPSPPPPPPPPPLSPRLPPSSCPFLSLPFFLPFLALSRLTAAPFFKGGGVGEGGWQRRLWPTSSQKVSEARQ